MDKKIYEKVAVGGTFDKFHEGHKKLLKTAFDIGVNVEIGVTSNSFVELKGDIDPCSERIASLKSFFSDKSNFTITTLDDSYGPTIYDSEFDAIVVSEETEQTALEINEIRIDRGMQPLDIIIVNFVLAEDGNPISSTRIRKGEINKIGKILN